MLIMFASCFKDSTRSSSESLEQVPRLLLFSIECLSLELPCPSGRGLEGTLSDTEGLDRVLLLPLELAKLLTGLSGAEGLSARVAAAARAEDS